MKHLLQTPQADTHLISEAVSLDNTRQQVLLV
jgi:hypothetical protein